MKINKEKTKLRIQQYAKQNNIYFNEQEFDNNVKTDKQYLLVCKTFDITPIYL